MPQKNRFKAGSLDHDEPAFLVLGLLRRAHGVKGEIPLEVHTQLLNLLSPDSVVFVGETYQPFTIESTRWKNDLLLMKFHEINDRTLVSELTNQLLFVKTDLLPPLTEEEIYYHELIGLEVYEQGGIYLGDIVQILETGANDVFVVQDESGGEVLIPAVDDWIVDIDIPEGKMIVSKTEWYGEGD